jgi:hypothetical protein
VDGATIACKEVSTMRRPFTTLALAGACGLIALAAVAALGAGLVRGGRSDPGAGAAQAGSRTWPLTLSPAPDDLALAQVSFHAPGRERLPKGSLRLAVSGPFGADYLAAATPRLATPGAARVLVLLVNRPSALLDPASVHLRLLAWRSLGAPAARTLEDPLARAGSAATPALCDLPVHGSPLAGSELRVLSSRGGALAGFDAAGAIAQAYDLACGLPYEAAFRQAVEPPASTSPSPPAPPVTPAPSPPPPVGKLPGEGCVPRPGYACPG